MYRPHFEITPRLLNLVAEISSVRELINSAYILPQWDFKLRRQAMLQMAHHSTAIEGNPLNSEQVSSLFRGEDVAAREKDKQEILNYLSALRLVDELGNKGLPLIERETIMALHSTLMKGLLPQEELGTIRSGRVAVLDHLGRIVFQAPPAEQVPSLLENLLQWINGPSRDFHPVIVSGVSHYELVRIHPFTDGNGRTARLLATLILYLRGFDTKRFFVLDEYYNTDLKGYYSALALADRTGELTGWLEYFAEGVAVSLKKVKEAINELSLESRLKEKKGQIYLDERQREVIRVLKREGRLRISDVQRMFQVSREMANRILDPLLENGLIVRRGLGRATYYELS
ncbi:MAG: Fic family protein [Caldiserica bacterium]|nr:Fic family protein [Caldisericota bacterium]